MENNELLKEVESLVQEVEKTHRYSMSRIYGAYNKVFDTNERPQACASCLIRKMKDLKQWLDKNTEKEATTPASAVKKTSAKPRKKRTTAPKTEDK